MEDVTDDQNAQLLKTTRNWLRRELTTAELDLLETWLSTTTLNATLLETALAGEVVLHPTGGEMKFQLSLKGQAEVSKLLPKAPK